jgi:hypothetical protein
LGIVDLYAVLRLYVNYFQPSLKLLSKTRDGSKVTKKYDKAQTPCQRLLSSESVFQECKNKLKLEYESLDPVYLLDRLKKCQTTFWKHAWSMQKNTENYSQHELVKNGLPNNPEIKNQTDLPNCKYRRTKKPRKLMGARSCRTRRDPFEEVWEDLRLQL